MASVNDLHGLITVAKNRNRSFIDCKSTDWKLTKLIINSIKINLNEIS